MKNGEWENEEWENGEWENETMRINLQMFVTIIPTYSAAGCLSS